MTSIPVPWSLVGQLLEHGAKMGVGFYPRQKRLPHMMLSEEKLEKMERKSPPENKKNVLPCPEMRWFSLT